MRAFKIYLYKRQIKKRNSLIYLLLFRFLEALVLFFFRTFFLLFLVRLHCVLFFLKIFEFEKEFREAVRNCRRVIDVILHKNFCIWVFHIDDFKHYRIRILFFLREFLFNNFFYLYVLRRFLVNIYYFLIFFFFFHSSATALLYWAVKSFR